MAFDWSKKSKEKYYSKADRWIIENGYENILSIDRSMFTVRTKGKECYARIYFKGIPRKGMTKKWQAVKKAHKNVDDYKMIGEAFGRKEKDHMIHGYIEIGLEDAA